MADVTAASFPIQLAGQEYRMSPLTDRDIDEITNWLRSTLIQMARDSLGPNATQAEREETLAVAMREARNLDFFTKDGAKALRDLKAVARVIWQSLRREHPALTHEQVRVMLTDARTIDHAMEVWRELNVGTRAKTKGGTAQQNGSPKAGRRRRGRRRTRN